MTPKQQKLMADELIRRANKIAKAKIEAASDKKSASAKLRYKTLTMAERSNAEWNSVALAKPTRESILLKAGEEQLLGRFAGRESGK